MNKRLRKDVIFLGIIIILLIGYIIHLKSTGIFPSKLQLPSNMAQTLTNAGISSEDNPISEKEYYETAIEIFAALDAQSVPGTYSIPHSQAHSLYVNYRDNIQDASYPDTTRATYFTLPELFNGIKEKFGNRRLSNDIYANASFYAYLGRYGAGSAAPYQTTVVLQLAEDKDVNPPEVDSPPYYYNFGDLCPQKCPINETIITK